MSFWEFVWFIVITYAFLAYLMVLFSIVRDLFRDRELSGGLKAVWLVALVFFPLLAALVYVLTRGRGMTERNVQDVEHARQAQESYIREVAGTGSPADQIAKAREMLDAQVITQEEFERLKAKALA